nr:PREDICTED: cyclin-B1-2-like [Raphanus sativus]
MATRTNMPEQVRGVPVVADGVKIQSKNGAVVKNNRRALGDIGNNLVSVPVVPQGGKPQPPINRPITRSFRAQLLANAAQKQPINVENKAVKKQPRQPLAPTRNNNQEAQKAVPKKNLVIKLKQQETKHAQVVVEPAKEVEKPKVSPKKKNATYSSVLSARSKAACGGGITSKPKKILDIDESDRDNHLAAVEYVDDMYSFYKEVEKESQPKMYMHIQTEMNEKMRAILVDWLLEVHVKFELNLETLYLTVNIIDRFLSVKAVPKRELQLLGISALLIASKYEEIWPPQVNDLVYVTDNAYNNKQILVMEKTILGNLEWYLTVPTQYVFLVRFIKASMSDPEMENMVHFLAELGMMHYDTLKFCPSMLAASAVYTARCSLNKIPAWSETLEFHSGYAESEIMECSKLLALHHSRCGESRLRAVYKKYSKVENGGVALVSPAKSLLSAASLHA